MTIYDTHINHIWTNAPIQQCMLKIVETYWTDQKPIYFTFKLPDYVLQYHHISWIISIYTLGQRHSMISCLLHSSLAGAQVCCILYQPQHTHQNAGSKPFWWAKPAYFDFSSSNCAGAHTGHGRLEMVVYIYIYTHTVMKMASKLWIWCKLNGY